MTKRHRPISVLMATAFLCAVAHAQVVDPRIAPVNASIHVSAEFQRNVNVVSSQQIFNPNTSVESKVTPAGGSSHANVTGVTQQQSGPNIERPSASSTWGPLPLTRGATGPQGANITDSANKPRIGTSRAKLSSATTGSVSELSSSSDEVSSSGDEGQQRSHRTGAGSNQLSSNRAVARMKKQRRPTVVSNVCPAEPLSVHPTSCEIRLQQSANQTGGRGGQHLAPPVRQSN